MRRTVTRRAAAVMFMAAVTLATSGCGVMFGGTKQVVRASSSPDGATVSTKPETADTKTPASLNLERKHEYVLTFSMTGYSSQQVQMKRSMRGGILFLDIITCCLSVVVDAVTGGWYQLSPDLVNVRLTKTDAAAQGPDVITVTLDVKPTKNGSRVQVGSTAPGVNVDVQPR